jgi:protein tyrosine phosphatase
MKWSGELEVVFQNKMQTVGVVRIKDDDEKNIHNITGYWNKELLQQAMGALDLFDYRDVKVSVIEDEESNSSMLLIKPANSETKIRIAVAGKTSPRNEK